eukprot:12099843-Ditylum_brightwellii.AAC.1
MAMRATDIHTVVTYTKIYVINSVKHVLHELGFLDLENIHLYTKDGPKDENNKVLAGAFSYEAPMTG